MNKTMIMFFFILFMGPLIVFGQIGPNKKPFFFISDTNFSGVVGSGARAFGMGGAFIAVADDATAASWNPGGLGQLEKPELSLVGRYQNYRTIQPASIASDQFQGPQDNDGNMFGFDFLSFTYPIRVGDFKLVPQVSYQRSISFDLNTRMNEVNFYSIDSMDDKIEGIFNKRNKFRGGIDMVSFSLGWKLFKRINMGVSVNYIMNGFTGTQNLIVQAVKYGISNPDVKRNYESRETQNFTTKIKGVNFNIGVLVDALENLKIGAVYKSASSIDFDYSIVHRSEVRITGEPDRTSETNYANVSSLKWPHTWGIGVSYRPSDPLTLSVDFTSSHWSKALLKDFISEENPDGTDLYFPTFTEVNTAGKYKQIDSQQFRCGMEYVVFGKNRVFIPLRFGIFTDGQYYTDSTGKKLALFGITGGVGIKKGAFSVDAAALYEFGNFLKSNVDYSDTLFADLRFYLSVIYSF